MRILEINISNFRGIKKANISFSEESRVLCMIGAGDNTKTTILKAIEWLLWDTWNLSASDHDFYNSDTSSSIIIRGTFTEIPGNLLTEDKFGMYLRRPGVVYKAGENDEPTDDSQACLTIQLEIDATLEPKWFVICNRLEPKPISHMDRKQMQLGSVGDNCSRDMVWGKTSILQRYIDSQKTLHQAYTTALRDAIDKAELKPLDDISSVLRDVGKQYGVGFTDEINNKIIMQNGSFSSAVGVFDGKVPLTQKGRGTQRLLSIGLNIQSFSGKTLLLIDEVETGLEPYRLKSLIAELRSICADSGQVIMTTHSPVALAECTTKEILIIQSIEGETKAFSLFSEDKDTNSTFQAELRRNAEAFLSKRLIVCEGKTEIGFVRALDSFLFSSLGLRMAHHGIGVADGGGHSISKCAEILKNCGYDICLLMDSDLSEEEDSKNELRYKGVSVFDWEQGNALEEQVFYDATMTILEDLIAFAVEAKGDGAVKSTLDSNRIEYTLKDDQIKISTIEANDRKKIGTKAKNKSWFKRIDLGEKLGDIVFSEWDSISVDAKLKSTVNELIEWINNNDE